MLLGYITLKIYNAGVRPRPAFATVVTAILQKSSPNIHSSPIRSRSIPDHWKWLISKRCLWLGKSTKAQSWLLERLKARTHSRERSTLRLQAGKIQRSPQPLKHTRTDAVKTDPYDGSITHLITFIIALLLPLVQNFPSGITFDLTDLIVLRSHLEGIKIPTLLDGPKTRLFSIEELSSCWPTAALPSYAQASQGTTA